MSVSHHTTWVEMSPGAEASTYEPSAAQQSVTSEALGQAPLRLEPWHARALEKMANQVYVAEIMADRLREQVEAFAEDLPEDQEVGVMVPHFGSDMILFLDEIGFHNPSLLSLECVTREGRRVCLTQHSAQVSLLLVGVPRRA